MTEMHVKAVSCSLKGSNPLKDRSINSMIILNWILKEICERVYTRFIWLRTASSGDKL
jgi:hypothetical protein